MPAFPSLCKTLFNEDEFFTVENIFQAQLSRTATPPEVLKPLHIFLLNKFQLDYVLGVMDSLTAEVIVWLALVTAGPDGSTEQHILQVRADAFRTRVAGRRDGSVGLACWVYSKQHPPSEARAATIARPSAPMDTVSPPVVRAFIVDVDETERPVGANYRAETVRDEDATYARLAEDVSEKHFTQDGGPSRAKLIDAIHGVNVLHNQMGRVSAKRGRASEGQSTPGARVKVEDSPSPRTPEGTNTASALLATPPSDSPVIRRGPPIGATYRITRNVPAPQVPVTRMAQKHDLVGNVFVLRS